MLCGIFDVTVGGSPPFRSRKTSFFLEVPMRPVKRGYVNKGQSARKFRGQAGRTKAANLRGAPMRGGWRL